MKGLVEAYRALSEVYLRKSWIGEAVKQQGDALLQNKGSFRLVYGVVEHEFLFEYRIARFAEKSPKPAVKILLKMGMYLAEFSDLPDHAAVSEIVKTAKAVGKGGVGGFLNAFLRRYVTEGKSLMPQKQEEILSVKANLPVWLVRRYQKELGDKATERLLAPRDDRTHVRASFAFGNSALAKVLAERGISAEQTEYGFFIREVGKLSDLLKEGKATVMSYGSASVCAALPYEGGKILDLCAAPGGKSVFLAEKFGAEVLACDLYPHRVELIEKYAERMGVTTIRAIVHDGTVEKEEWQNAFPAVLLDAPCSGLGSLSSNPDVALNRTPEDLTAIIETQKRLIVRAAEYVAKGGVLLYATCSDLPSEDEDIVKFLAEMGNFALEKQCYTDPIKGGGESYYYALLRKQ